MAVIPDPRKVSCHSHFFLSFFVLRAPGGVFQCFCPTQTVLLGTALALLRAVFCFWVLHVCAGLDAAFRGPFC